MSDTTSAELLRRLEDIEAKLDTRRDTAQSDHLADVQASLEAHEKTLATLQPVLARLESSQREIMAAIKGDEYGNEGVAGRLRAIEQTQSKHAELLAGHDRRIFAGGLIISVVWSLALVLKDRIFK